MITCMDISACKVLVGKLQLEEATNEIERDGTMMLVANIARIRL